MVKVPSSESRCARASSSAAVMAEVSAAARPGAMRERRPPSESMSAVKRSVSRAPAATPSMPDPRARRPVEVSVSESTIRCPSATRACAVACGTRMSFTLEVSTVRSSVPNIVASASPCTSFVICAYSSVAGTDGRSSSCARSSFAARTVPFAPSPPGAVNVDQLIDDERAGIAGELRGEREPVRRPLHAERSGHRAAQREGWIRMRELAEGDRRSVERHVETRRRIGRRHAPAAGHVRRLFGPVVVLDVGIAEPHIGPDRIERRAAGDRAAEPRELREEIRHRAQIERRERDVEAAELRERRDEQVELPVRVEDARRRRARARRGR